MTPVIARNDRSPMSLVILAFLGFIAIGMPGAVRGVVWGDVRAEFVLPLDALGALILATTISYFLSSALTGRIIARLGLGNALVLSYLMSGVGLLGYVFAQAWPLMIICAFLIGTGLGFVDAAMNVYFAAHHGPRLMNWLHACFGIGSAIAPIVVTLILESGGGWRTGYLAIFGLFALLLLAFWWTRAQWVVTPASDPAAAQSAPARATLSMAVVWLGILLFFVYAGVELVPSDWGPSLFRLERGFTQLDAANLISTYWFFFTAGRIAFGFVVPYIKPRLLIRLCMAVMVVGALLLAASNSGNQLAPIGLILGAFAMSPLFALLVTATQERLGTHHAPNAIGFQVAAASAGAGLLPAVTGIVAQRTSLEAVPIVWLGLCLAVVVFYELSQRLPVKSG